MEASSSTVQHYDRYFSLSSEIIRPDHPKRALSEAYIAAQYLKHFQATVTHFLEELLVLVSVQGDIVCASGVRAAGSSWLFLEQYLTEPIEATLRNRLGVGVCRNKIAEIGNLATSSVAALTALYLSLNAYLDGRGFEWGVFTVTSPIRRALMQLSVDLIDFGPAEACRLDVGHAGDWGAYYRHDPRVMAASVHATKRILTTELGSSNALSRMWSQAYQLGCEVGPVCRGGRCGAK